ncbi:glycosyltransferase family 4 protein [Thiocapsa marina]|uniref:Glycosyl transferase group 1 n=1 Tax=Thiocapsa marina 5811 TaxID=768671 RepID=F9U6A6_9GAMM|nr:glycosyltransferase [Thiocapsa marina]EGV20679.1 glycosyl transferase group 1 [Thiocapsa marina 5811]
MKVVVAQLGARMHYAVARILYRAGRLEHLYTDITATKGWPRLLRAVPDVITPASVRRLKARVPIGISESRITAFTSFGLDYVRRCRRGGNISDVMATHLWAGSRFNELVLAGGFGEAQAVYGFNSASQVLFSGAKAAGLSCVLEQSSAPRRIERELMRDVTARFPGWHDNKLADQHGDAFADREAREWALADSIFCPSEFVKDGLIQSGVAPSKCVVVPYGVDIGRQNQTVRSVPQRSASGPFNVLFVGRVGLQKGATYLIEALSKLRDRRIHCRMVGSIGIDMSLLRSLLPDNVEVVGAVPRSEIGVEYANADLFCLPSLCEGSATVIYEALAAGLPVVTTPNAGSIVRHGVEGFIVPIQDADALADRLAQLEADRTLLAQMRQAALSRSAYGSIASYGQRLLDALDSIPRAQ